MKNFKKWLDQALVDYKSKKVYKKETSQKEKKELPEGMLLTTYIAFIDAIIIIGLITIFIIKIL